MKNKENHDGYFLKWIIAIVAIIAVNRINSPEQDFCFVLETALRSVLVR